MNDIKEKLLSVHARAISLEVAEAAIADTKVLKKLITYFREADYRLNQRISWVLALLAEKRPDLLEPYQIDLLQSLENEPSDALKRNVLRIWNITGVSEDISGKVFDKCLQYLLGVNAIAIKAHGMDVAYAIAKPYPELCEELKPVIQMVLVREGDSAGIRSKARKVLKLLA